LCVDRVSADSDKCLQQQQQQLADYGSNRMKSDPAPTMAAGGAAESGATLKSILTLAGDSAAEFKARAGSLQDDPSGTNPLRG
jgi:hypothetical protein